MDRMAGSQGTAKGSPFERLWICRRGKGPYCTFLAESHDTLRIRTEDSNRSRWRCIPLWIDLQQRIAALHMLESKHLDGKRAGPR